MIQLRKDNPLWFDLHKWAYTCQKAAGEYSIVQVTCIHNLYNNNSGKDEVNDMIKNLEWRVKETDQSSITFEKTAPYACVEHLYTTLWFMKWYMVHSEQVTKTLEIKGNVLRLGL
jgi:hypothetical protein